MIAFHILSPSSKLASTREWRSETASMSLGGGSASAMPTNRRRIPSWTGCSNGNLLLSGNWQGSLIFDHRGCPVAIQVFEGNTNDPDVFSEQMLKVKQRFGLERLIIVGDRGLITQARITEILSWTLTRVHSPLSEMRGVSPKIPHWTGFM